MRLDGKAKAELCFALLVPLAVYLLIVLAAHGMRMGWW